LEIIAIGDQIQKSTLDLQNSAQVIDDGVNQLQVQVVKQIEACVQISGADYGGGGSSFQPSPSLACSSRVQTSNRLLLEFLTQNSKEENFMST